MKTLRLMALGFLLMGPAGCWSPPFHETPRVPMGAVDPRELAEGFGRRLPDPLQVVNTATFEFAWHSLVVLGATKVDAAKGTFTIVGLHPTGGVKLFEVVGDRTSITHSFAQPQLAEHGDLVTAIADDARRIYLDRVPSENAIWTREEDEIRFEEPAGAGTLEYVFAGADGVLIEKSYAERESPVWTVRYYDYRQQQGALYPMGIVLTNHDHGYRVILRVKEILS